MAHPGQDPLKKDATQPSPEPRIIPAEELFRGGREVWIDLGDVRYRLRITKRKKLILQK